MTVSEKEYNYDNSYSKNDLKVNNDVQEDKEIKQKKEISKEVTLLKKVGVSATTLLPISSRGISSILLKSGFQLVKALGTGLVQSVRGEPVTAFTKMKENLKSDMSKGIQDKYTDITKMDKAEAKKILDEGLHYYEKHQYKTKSEVNFPTKDGFRDVYKKIDEKLKGMDFKRDKKGSYYNTKTGTMLNLSLDKDKKEIVVCFWGLGNENPDEENTRLCLYQKDAADESKITKASNLSVVLESTGHIGAAGLEAMKIGEMLKNETSKVGLTPVVVGHSHGGGLAQCAALANGIKTIVFNSRPMGAGMRRLIGQDKIAKNAENITVFSVKGDWLTGTKILNKLSVIYERLTGVVTPRTAGKGYIIQCKPGSNAHNDIKLSLQHTQSLLNKEV